MKKKSWIMHTKYSELGKCYFYDNGGCCKFVKFIYLVSVESNNSKAFFYGKHHNEFNYYTVGILKKFK